MLNKKKVTYNIQFSDAENAKMFREKIDKETEGRALFPFTGNKAELDTKHVLVVGTGSALFDLKLKAVCEEYANKFGGVFLN